MHQMVFHGKPDPETVIHILFGCDSKGLADRIRRGEILLQKVGDGTGQHAEQEEKQQYFINLFLGGEEAM